MYFVSVSYTHLLSLSTSNGIFPEYDLQQKVNKQFYLNTDMKILCLHGAVSKVLTQILTYFNPNFNEHGIHILHVHANLTI